MRSRSCRSSGLSRSSRCRKSGDSNIDIRSSFADHLRDAMWRSCDVLPGCACSDEHDLIVDDSLLRNGKVVSASPIILPVAQMERRLTAILAADVVGFSRMMGAD